VVLLFKDSKSGTAEPKATSNDFHKARASEKITGVRLIAPKDFPFTNFGPAISEAAEPNRCYTQRDLATQYIWLV
jgi:hypothetical protein